MICHKMLSVWECERLCVVFQLSTRQAFPRSFQNYFTHISQVGQLHMCWFAGASLDNRAATLVCWLGCSGKPGKATCLFIEVALTGIYRTGCQCGRYSTVPRLSLGCRRALDQVQMGARGWALQRNPTNSLCQALANNTGILYPCHSTDLPRRWTLCTVDCGGIYKLGHGRLIANWD